MERTDKSGNVLPKREFRLERQPHTTGNCYSWSFWTGLESKEPRNPVLDVLPKIESPELWYLRLQHYCFLRFGFPDIAPFEHFSRRSTGSWSFSTAHPELFLDVHPVLSDNPDNSFSFSLLDGPLYRRIQASAGCENFSYKISEWPDKEQKELARAGILALKDLYTVILLPRYSTDINEVGFNAFGVAKYNKFALKEPLGEVERRYSESGTNRWGDIREYAQRFSYHIGPGIDILLANAKRGEARNLPASKIPIPLDEYYSWYRVTKKQVRNALGELGYPGFRERSGDPMNPAAILYVSLCWLSEDIEVLRSLPWVVLHHPDIDWDWLTAKVVEHSHQNALGFIVALAHELAERKGLAETAVKLEGVLRVLDVVKTTTSVHLDELFPTEATHVLQEHKEWFKAHSPHSITWRVGSKFTADNLGY